MGTYSKRHAGHHHSDVHAHVALHFWYIAFGLLLVYSTAVYLHGVLRPKKRFHYRVPWWALTAAWGLVCAYGFFSHSKSELGWVARRFGRMGLAIAVFGQFLTFKPAVLPCTYTLPLTAIHKWVGRTAVVSVSLHGLLFFFSHIKSGEIAELFSIDNMFGMFSLGCFVVIGLTSLPFFRRRWYAVFHAIHYTLAWVSILAMFKHARPSANLVVEVAIFFFVLQILLRVFMSKSVQISVEHVTPTLDLVTMDRRALPEEFDIGSHLRVSPKLTHPGAWLFASHPYTVASLDSDSSIKLVVRKYRYAPEAGTVTSWGPFRAPFDLLNYSKVVVIGGGAGVALVSPILRVAHEGSTKVKAIWITRSVEEVAILPQLGVNECDVYITREPEQYEETKIPETSSDEESGAREDVFELDSISSENEENLSQAGERLLSQDDSSKSFQETDSNSIRILKQRPEIGSAIGNFLTPEDADGTACVVACGPNGLIADAREWATAHKYDFFAENFNI